MVVPWSFTSQLLWEMYNFLMVQAIWTTPYHHQTEGLVECFNQTLKQMLCKWANEDGKDWDRWLPYPLLAYWEVLQANCLRYCRCLWMEYVWSISCVKKVCVWYKCMWPVGHLSLSMGVPHHSHTCHLSKVPHHRLGQSLRTLTQGHRHHMGLVNVLGLANPLHQHQRLLYQVHHYIQSYGSTNDFPIWSWVNTMLYGWIGHWL